MEPGMELEMTPRATADLAHYFISPPSTGVSAAGIAWPEADQQLLSLFDTPSYDRWREEDHSKYIDANHPMVIDDYELELATSDHSDRTPSDSGGSSSNTFSTASLPSNASAGHSGLSSNPDWQRYPAAYNPHGDVMLPYLDLAGTSPTAYGLADHANVADSFYSHPGHDILSPPVNLATFHDTPLQETYVAQVRAHPHPDSSLSSLSPLSSLHDHPCISMSQLNAPYIPDPRAHLDINLKTFSSPSAEDLPSVPRKRTRPTASRGRSQIKGLGGQRASAPFDAQSQPVKGLSRTRRRAPSFTPSASSDSEGEAPVSKRIRQSVVPKTRAAIAKEDDADEGESDVTDSDVYTPSRSPSPDPTGSDYSDGDSYPASRAVRKGTKLTKGNLFRIGAADALAQVSGSTPNMEQGGDWEDENESISRKNHSIPLPVPVPHLIKKSRGRKVPYVNIRVAKGLFVDDATYDGDDDDSGIMRGGSSRQGRGRGGGRGSSGRTFVCTVEGCGKCFIRGEHLKRHVRSIHTHDKPHICPYLECGKSFSRRDNLGQHVRLHLMGSA